mgnify:CR=1 FL=1
MTKLKKIKAPYINSKCYVCKEHEPLPAVALWKLNQEVWVCISHLGTNATKKLDVVCHI